MRQASGNGVHGDDDSGDEVRHVRSRRSDVLSPTLSPTAMQRENRLAPVLQEALESMHGGIQSPPSLDGETDDGGDDHIFGSMDDLLSEGDSWLLEDEDDGAMEDHFLSSLTMASAAASAAAAAATVNQYRSGITMSKKPGFPFNLLRLVNRIFTTVMAVIRFWTSLIRRIVRLLLSAPFLFRKPYLENSVSPMKRGLLSRRTAYNISLRRRGARRPSIAATLGMAADRVHRKEKVTSGLFEDILTAHFQFIDEAAIAAKFATRLWLPSAFNRLISAVRLFHPKNFISKEGIDLRTIRQLIRDEGYPYEKVEVVTKDGYILRMDRIPNRRSNKIVFFQHGILDSAFAWVAQGADNSIAFRAHNEGYDVWMGNFRGYGLSLKTAHRMEGKDYWDYSFNEHAFYDVRAFVEKIVETKRQELGCHIPGYLSRDNEDNQELQRELREWDRQNFHLTAIAHSMGAASILAYVVNQRVHRLEHHLDNAILLSPAGIHEQIPMILRIPALIVLPLVPSVIPLRYAGFTSVTNKIIVSKLFQDINNHPAMRSLFATLTSLSLLGGPVKSSPFQRIHNIWMHTFNGTSVKVLRHFVQMSAAQKFQAFDYGAKGNMEHYQSKEPLDFLENYHLVDVPVTIVYGDDDRIIPAENVLRHYVALQTFHPRQVTLKRFDRIGHLDLCHGADEQLIQYVLKALRRARRKRGAPIGTAV